MTVIGRRRVIRIAGRGVVGFAMLGLVPACGNGGDEAGRGTTSSGSPSSGTPTDPTASPSATGLAWSRVDLGFVAAYVLVRGREAAVVDTGVGGSAGDIGATLEEAGPGWAGVRHVVLTHKHPDHVGSLGEVMAEAPSAMGYVGAADLTSVDSARQLTAVADGDEVFGLQIIGTPGHTAGHVAVFDAGTGVLVAGDALTNGSGLAGSDPQFTEDADAAAESVRKLAMLAPRTILVGHGSPVTDGAAAALNELAASLG